MKRKSTRFIVFFVSFFIVIGAYLYLANAFIYYRIGSGNLSAPIIKDSYLMNENLPTDKSLTYVALGDSLTNGAGVTKHNESFPYLIGEKIAGSDKKVILENASYPGAKTEDLIANLLEPAIALQPDVVTVLIGVNDIHNHITKEKFEVNYRHILERLTKGTSAKIYIINIPLIGSNTAILPPLNLYFEAETKKFNSIIKELATEYNLTYIDLYSPTKEMLRKDSPYYSADSFHPSAVGYKEWAHIIYDNFDK